MLLGVTWGSPEVNRTIRKSCELPAGCMIFSQEINGVFSPCPFLNPPLQIPLQGLVLHIPSRRGPSRCLLWGLKSDTVQSSLLPARECEAGSSEWCTEVLCRWERQVHFSPTHTYTPLQDLYLRGSTVQVTTTHFFSAWHNEEVLELHNCACVCSKLVCKVYEFCVSLQSGESSFSVLCTDMIQKHRAGGSLRLQSEMQCLVFAEVFPACRVWDSWLGVLLPWRTGESLLSPLHEILLYPQN